jgi:hypothetical protein
MPSNTDKSGISPRARSITTFVEAAAAQLQTLDTSSPDDERNKEQGALLYFGNWQDPIPRLLILDRTLDAGDVRLWAYLRTLFTQPGMPTVFPSYRQIQQDLPMARATLAGCISTLRATRWITRCLTVRDARGRYKGNIYALHEEPLNLADTLHLDSEYMAFLARATQHSYKRVRTIASAVLDTIRDRIGEDCDITISPSVLEQTERRFHQLQPTNKVSGWSAIGNSQAESLITPATEVIHSLDPSSESERGKNRENLPGSDFELGKSNEYPPSSNSKLGKNREFPPSSDSEPGKNGEYPPSSDSEPGEKTNLRTSISSGCCSSSFLNKKTTTTPSTNIPHACEEQQDTATGELILPSTLKPNEQPLVIMQIERIPEEMRQDVLDQLSAGLNDKNRKEPVRDPLAYLCTLCRCVLSGEFEMTSRGLAVREQRMRQAVRQQREREAIEAHDQKVKAHIESLRQRSRDKEE